VPENIGKAFTPKRKAFLLFVACPPPNTRRIAPSAGNASLEAEERALVAITGAALKHKIKRLVFPEAQHIRLSNARER
jgi:hypothetical protein